MFHRTVMIGGTLTLAFGAPGVRVTPSGATSGTLLESSVRGSFEFAGLPTRSASQWGTITTKSLLHRYGRGVRWSAGERVVGFLLERGRLEPVAADVEAAYDALLERAAKRLTLLERRSRGEDWEGAFANAYDVYGWRPRCCCSARACGQRVAMVPMLRSRMR
jgi:hypothetical protein